MRTRVVAVVAVVVLTAGCSGFVGGGGSTPTLTPADVPTEEPTPADPRIGVAPGLSPSDVTHPDFLAQRHAEAADATSYVLVEQYHEDRRFGEVASELDRTQRIVVENETVYRRSVSNRHEAIVDGEVRALNGYAEYADGESLYKSWLSPQNNERVHRRSPDPTQRPAYATLTQSEIRRYVDLDAATVARHDVPTSDREHYRVTGTRDSLPSFSVVENYTATAVIREDGFVRTLNVTFDAEHNGRVIAAQYNMTYREVGTATVRPPAWAETTGDSQDN